MRGAKKTIACLSMKEKTNVTVLINQNKTCINTGSSGLQRNR